MQFITFYALSFDSAYARHRNLGARACTHPAIELEHVDTRSTAEPQASAELSGT